MNPDDEGPDLDSVADCEEKTVDLRMYQNAKRALAEARAWGEKEKKKDA